MKNYFLSNQAIVDLGEIAEYTRSKWSQAQAKKYYLALMETITTIANYSIPLGKDYSYIKEGLKGYKMKSHVIFYFQLSDGDILVVRILHEKMDFPSNILS